MYFHGEFKCNSTDLNIKYFKLLDDHRIRSKVIETAVTKILSSDPLDHIFSSSNFLLEMLLKCDINNYYYGMRN